MGSAASATIDLPERVDYETCQHLISKINREQGSCIYIDKFRFELMMDDEGTVGKSVAMQFVENKFVPILSSNVLATHDTGLLPRRPSEDRK